MGFRSTLTGEDYNIKWPDWFKDKYGESVSCFDTLSLNSEVKTYSLFSDLPADVHRALIELNWFHDDMAYSMVWLHECGGITKVQINAEGVRMADPLDWEEVFGQDGRHCYCYGCTDLRDYCSKTLEIPATEKENPNDHYSRIADPYDPTIQALIQWFNQEKLKELEALASSNNWRVLLEDRIQVLKEGKHGL